MESDVFCFVLEFNFLTMKGKVNPCPISVKRTTATEIKIMALRSGKGFPSSRNLGSPMAMARDTIPLIPDQPKIILLLKSKSASSLIFLLPPRFF